MNTISHKMPALWGTIVLVMGLLYACSDADSGGDSGPLTLTAGDITYDKDRIAQGTVGTATASSETITDLSILTFTIDSITPYGGTGTQERPAIAEDGTISTTADTTAGSYRVTITPDGSAILGDPFTVDFYVTTKPADIAALDTTLQTAIANYSVTGDFNYIDTSVVTNMSYLFASGYTPGTGVEESTRTYIANFNGDISKWNVSAVKNFSYMFSRAAAFNQDIGDWIVSAGENFSWMFRNSTAFNQDIGGWDVSSGTNFRSMFTSAAAFNQDIGGWVVSSGTDFSTMFFGATSFNQDVGSWNVAAGENFSYMFSSAAAFNQDIGNWVVSKGTDFSYMFEDAVAFNQDLSSWNLASTVTKTNMFTNSGVTSPPSWYQ